MAGTPIDDDVVLFDNTMNEGNDGNGTAVTLDGPGSYDAELHIMFDTPTGDSPTLDVHLEYSVDGGSSWIDTGFLRQFVGTDTPDGLEDKFHYSRPVHIPGVPPPSSPTWDVSEPDPVQVRIVSSTGGSTPVFPDCVIWLGTPDRGATKARRA